MITRVVVADERGASFLDASGLRTPFELRTTLLNDNAGLKDQDLETDRAGRGSNTVGRGGHGMDGERSTRRHLLELFAHHVATQIDEARKRNEFEKLVIVAGPRMLGLIREGLSVPCRALVVAEVDKDLSHLDMQAIRDAVPREAFSQFR
ncbi:MAG TPA: host attachment protein [Povalibacter sp.]|nr:host attachment protein [Povalibacter sp.]